MKTLNKYTTMKKEVDLTIRLNSELKIQISKKAKELGFSTSAFVRSLIIKSLML